MKDIIKNYKKIMIFGKPGIGKSTFSVYLSKILKLQLYHLDKYFYINNWIERDYEEFLNIQRKIVNNNQWIIYGNSTKSLEIRWSEADLVIYFNISKVLCYMRILKRFFYPNNFDDRAPNCQEKISYSLLRYTWSFERRVKNQIIFLKKQYPHTIFKEIKNEKELKYFQKSIIEN